MFDGGRLFPASPTLPVRLGVPYWTLVAVDFVEIMRSLLHMLLPDGGAQSIAGVPVDVAGGENIVAIFAQWGASQFVMALIVMAALVRYRALTPLMWLAIATEQALRLMVGQLKPLAAAHTPPGAYGTYVLLPLTLLMLLASLHDTRWREGGGDEA